MKPFLAVALAVVSTATAFAQAQTDEIKAPPLVSELGQSQQIQLSQAPGAVQRKVVDQAVVMPLQSLTAARINGQMIYEAQFQGATAQTRMQMAQDGSPLGFFITGTGVGNEAAGANLPEKPQQQSKQENELPDAVQNSIKRQLGEVQIQSVQPKRFYEVSVQQNGKEAQLEVAEDGKILGFRQGGK